MKCEEFNADKLVELDKKYYWHHLTQHKVFETQEPTIMVEGKGCIVKDVHGKEFLDGVSGGVWCVNVGYGQDTIAEAIYEQLKVLPYYAGSAGNPALLALAEKLTSLLPKLDKVYISNSGSEANEKAFKLSRQYSRLKYPSQDRYKIIFRERDYHGTTLAALSATGQPERKMGYEPLVPGFMGIAPAYCYRCSFGKSYPSCNMECAGDLEAKINQEGADTVAAVILEPITAGGGLIVPPDGYFEVIQEICQKYDVLLIMDEVVCGFGRTGKMFGHEHFNVDPDMVTMAKGLASAYMPISATVIKQKLFDRFLADPSDTMHYFRDISTFGGSAAACAGANANIKLIEQQKLCENSKEMGDYLIGRLKELESFPIVGDIRGKGLFVGIEFVEDKKTKAPVSEKVMGQILGNCTAQGVLLGKMNRSIPGFNNVLQIAPALIITKPEIDRIVDAIKNALEKVK
ncbi:aminotransferase [Desulfosporosinus sp. PR]|uniref:aminotransferase n=1 Tax=Candidatus Desulfosporosinus nitrosoreducens TaxID=3401928 RepID=UPI0027F4ECB6|nr:aminotransferase [Desulfosporosinus sp. PR]MDQ7095259.1 aminotransferase [Desulfosporosinus sp. PR]